MASKIDTPRSFTPENKRSRTDKYQSETMRASRLFGFDDLIVALDDTYENRRARQVTEWERLRRKTFRATL